MKLKIGDKAPDFDLKDQNGETFNLNNALGEQHLVLFFYPKAHTPGCTKEACAFRDSYEVFKDAGADVIGISAGSQEAHHSFGEKYRLPFTLLNDKGNVVRKLFGVKKTLGILPGRVTYVINKEGIVIHIFDAQFNFSGHIDEALDILKNSI